MRLTDLDPSRLHVLPLGIGNAFTRRRFNSSLLLIAGGKGVLIDCPAPLRRVLHDAGLHSGLDVDLDEIGDVVLTHLHGDHCNGLEELGFYRRYILALPPPRLHLLPEVIEPLWEHRLRASMGERDTPGRVRDSREMRDFFDVHPWDADAEHSVELGGGECLLFRIRRTRHFIPCFGFVARYRDWTVGYSADTAFEREHVAFLEGADLIIHETGAGAGHTPLPDLLALPEGTRRRMALIHVPDDFDAAGCPIPTLEEGRLITVGG